jgi:hypothetical protein
MAGWSEWAVPDGQGGWKTVTARAYLQWWVDHLRDSSDDLRIGFDALVAAGCDQLRLGWLLDALGGSVHWRRTSRGKLKHGVRDLRRAARTVRQLFFSDVNSMLDLRSLRLEHELEELAERAKALVPYAHARRPLRRDLVRAALVRYVRRTTGQWRDDEVAPLISVGESYGQSDRGTTYTTEAHVQWRHRPSCQSFLDDTSPLASHVNALEAAIDDTLRT